MSSSETASSVKYCVVGMSFTNSTASSTEFSTLLLCWPQPVNKQSNSSSDPAVRKDAFHVRSSIIMV